MRVDRGVFAVGYDDRAPEGRWMAAVLASGAGAVLSHGSAAALWGLRPGGLTPLEISTPRQRRSRRGVTVHRSCRLSVGEVTRKANIPVTRPARTLLDLAETLNRRELERALDEAERLGLCTEAQLCAAVERHRGRPGAAILSAVLEEHDLGSSATSNEFEELFFNLSEENGFPRPECNVRLGPYKPDFLWRAHRVIVEADGHATHRTRRAFESDRARDVELGEVGWRVLRFTWRQLTQRPDWVAEKVLNALSRTRRPAPRSSPPPP